MKIFDCVTYLNEDHLLELRFNILNEFVDYFVVCEAKEDHRGREKKLHFSLRDFGKDGEYGHYFNGPSQFNIHTDKFVVLELENLKVQPDLYRVVVLMVINAVTQDLYLSDRADERIIIFDEAWQFLSEGTMLAPVIEEGYRRARKYGGSFWTITQSLLDILKFGKVGQAINSNSAFKIMLESPDFTEAKKAGIIDYEDFTLERLKTLKSLPPYFSEIFMDTPFGRGITRLVVDPYTYFIYTSSAKEIAEIESLLDVGMTYDEAIRFMVKKHRG